MSWISIPFVFSVRFCGSLILQIAFPPAVWQTNSLLPLANSGFLLLHLVVFLGNFATFTAPNKIAQNVTRTRWRALKDNFHNMGLHRDTRITRAVEGSYGSIDRLHSDVPILTVSEKTWPDLIETRTSTKENKRKDFRGTKDVECKGQVLNLGEGWLKYGTLFVKLTDIMCFA